MKRNPFQADRKEIGIGIWSYVAECHNKRDKIEGVSSYNTNGLKYQLILFNFFTLPIAMTVKISVFFATLLIMSCACAGKGQSKVILIEYEKGSEGEACKKSLDQQRETPKKLSILGDSYSTFEGYIPEGYIAWYKPVPKEGRPTDVTRPEQTWWEIFMTENGYELETNNSYSGSTVCNTGYEGQDYSDRSFVNRVSLLGEPDLIIVFGGTNDAWAGVPLGEYVWENWKTEDLYAFRPAAAKTAYCLTTLYPGADVIYLVNDDINEEIKESTAEICRHYGISCITLHDIEKISGHPSQKGMRQIAEQLSEAIK